MSPFSLHDLASGAIVLIIGSVIKLISVWRGDGNKILDSQVEHKKIDLKADEQEAAQEQNTISVLRDLLTRADMRGDELERKFSAKVDALSEEIKGVAKELHESTIRYAVLQAEYRFMESRIAVLESQLQAAHSQNKAKDTRIVELERELSDSHAKVITLINKFREANEILGARNLPLVPLPPGVAEIE